MSNIIPLHGDRHQETQKLLPWYVNGTLDDAEKAQVDAHLASCPECRAALDTERRLKTEVAALPIETSEGWATLRRRIEETREAPRPIAPPATPPRAARRRPGRLGWIIAAQAAALVAAISVAVKPDLVQPGPRYHTLGSAPAPVAGNVIVMFRPSASEEQMRAALRGADARLVDGPTDANAYVLHVPDAQRAAALARLQALPTVMMAQPVDAEPSS